MISISDDRGAILEGLENASKKNDLIIITGGLGPTKDDITKNTLCEFFNTELVRNHTVFQMVEDFFKKRNKPFTKLNQDQALVPENCKVLLNYQGTAPAMWWERQGVIYVSLPGVPYEMKAILSEQVLPLLIKNKNLPEISHFTIFTHGIGESFLAEKIEHWEEKVKSSGFGLAYLPSPGMVKLRLSSYTLSMSQAETLFQNHFEELKNIIGNFIFGCRTDNSVLTMEKVVSELLLSNNKTLSVVESCTGGFISHLLTSIPGSSAYFRGSIVPYHNSYKTELLEVDLILLENYGAVSEECVTAMVQSSLKKFHSDFAIATSGIAGPTGGSDEKPVGMVWIAVASQEKIKAKKFLFGNDRIRNIQMASNSALNLLREFILE
jgi:nicotinamide-nucleotide amidase